MLIDAAIEINLPHGGWIPKGRLTDTGLLLEKYHLSVMPTKEQLKRAEQNVPDSDGTVILSHGFCLYARTLRSPWPKHFLIDAP